jgi:hypothetical protein
MPSPALRASIVASDGAAGRAVTLVAAAATSTATCCTRFTRASWLVIVAFAFGFAALPSRSTHALAACAPRWNVVAQSPGKLTLSGVAALAPDNVWAVGWAVGSARPDAKQIPVIVHWDGHELRRLKAFQPTASGGYMSAIDAVAPDDIWAVGMNVLRGSRLCSTGTAPAGVRFRPGVRRTRGCGTSPRSERTTFGPSAPTVIGR